MSGQQLCPASSKGMKERSSGSSVASGRRVAQSPRATHSLIQLLSLPGEDPPLRARRLGLPAPEARTPPLPVHPVPPASRARAAAGLPSRRCGGGSPPVPTLRLLVRLAIPSGPETQPLAPTVLSQSVYRPRTEQIPGLHRRHNSPPKRRVFPRNRPVGRDFRELRLRSRLACQ